MAEARDLAGTRVLILADDHVEDTELLCPLWWLRDAGADVKVAGRERRTYKGKKGTEVPAELTFQDALQERWDLVVVPGGYAPDRLRTYPEVLELVRRQDREAKPLGAICHAGWVLASAGVAKGRRLTSYGTIKDDLVHAGAWR